jgi:hypothetical protein
LYVATLGLTPEWPESLHLITTKVVNRFAHTPTGGSAGLGSPNSGVETPIPPYFVQLFVAVLAQPQIST